MANVTRSGRQSKDDDNSSKRKHTGTKGPSASGSTNLDSSGLRRSSREIPSKKQKVSSPSSTRKSERIEKRTPLTPPIKKKFEGVEKQGMPSPLRKSEKGENHRPSSSSGSRSSEKGLNLPDNKSKKEKRDNNGKQKTTNASDNNKGGEKDQRPVRIVVGKKRLDARSYRKSLLTPQAKNIKELENTEKPKDHSVTSQGDREASSSKEDDDVAEENREDVGRKDAGEGSDTEGPSSDLIKLEAGKSKNSGEIELSHYSRKRRIHSDEIHESNHGDSSTVSKCSYNNLQHSPGVSAKEVAGDAEKAQEDPPAMDNLLKVSTESARDGRSISGDQCMEKVYTSGSTKRKRKSEEVDSDASMIGASEDIYSSADPVTSSPSESKRVDILESCDACSKGQRFDADSQKCNTCSCNYGKNQNSGNNSSTEEVQEKESIPNPENDEMAMRSPINDGNAMDVNAIDDNIQEPAHGSESLSINQRNSEHDQTDVHTIVGINSLKEDESGESLENDHNACVVCKLGGKLLCCDGIGCKRKYHVDCLEPPIKVVPFGVWHCFQCVKRKIQFGVYAVSEGVETICDVREEESPDCQGIEKHYLVKYKGLAHVHNRWIPEHQLNLEAPSLIAKFMRSQVLKWKLDWTKPQRLLRKRYLISQNRPTEDFIDCRFELYVKWSGLGYEHASWELENAPFLKTLEARTLITDYETRLGKAIWASYPSREKILEKRKLSSFKLSELACSNVAGPVNDYLSSVNKLREYWRKNQNAVFVEDQERILKIVLFILSIQSDVCRPFLIISTSSTISAWEAEFMRSAPSVNVVVYSGNKDVRESIRALEFYEDSGCIMLQVLLSPIDAIIEDVDALELIGWEAIIVDECQCSTVSMHFEQIKKLTNGFRILLPSGPIKENVAEYLNLLSFIESGGDRNGDINMRADPGYILRKVKERFSRFVACDKKSDPTKFVEYWVPVRLSNVQIEQYCATLLSNSIPLCSCSKNDPVGALRDTLISVKKCCNHPYLVDQSLQSSLTKDLPEVEYLDVGVNASGKLQVLDKILLEIKKKGLRVLIIFQANCGSVRNYIGDILDDFLRQRFGADSYERVDSLLVNSKKQAALNMFNKKESGRFVFLIENRACSQSIKLSSVDMVILFDSDWNPFNDLRALQKITIDSQFEQIKVFRLYSYCTVEEKILSLAKQDMTLDSNLQNLNNGTSHTLLLWGAKLLFQKLEEFHNDRKQTNGSSISSDQSLLNDVVLEILNLLPDKAETSDMQNCEIVVKAQQTGTSYSKDLILLGEKSMEPRAEELPHLVWANILDGRYPRWRYTSGLFQRSRRKVQYYDQVPKKPQENDDTVKKRKKVASTNVDLNTPNSSLDKKRKSVSMDRVREGTFGTPTCNGSQNLVSTANTNSVSQPVMDQPEVHIAESNERRSLHDSQKSPHLSSKPMRLKVASMDKKGSVNHPVLDQPEMQIGESNEGRNLHASQKNLHLSLKPAILKLCEIFQFPDEVKSMAVKFVEYIMNNHNIITEPPSIFQAFQISLCWSAASLFKYKISHRKSLILAKQHLNFQCKEEETDLIYSKLRMLKKMFSAKPTSVAPFSAETSRDDEKRQFTLSQHELEEGEIESPKNLKCSVQIDSSKQNQASAPENGSGSSKTGSSKSIRKVNKMYSRRIKKLYQKQIEELEKFNKNKEIILEKEKAVLEVNHKLESALICSLHSQSSVRSDKLKMVDQELAKKMGELYVRMEMPLKNLEDMQRRARSEEAQLKNHWLQEAQFGRSVAEYATLPLSESGFREENMVEFEQVILEHDKSGSNNRAEHIDDCVRGGFDHEKEVTSSGFCLEKQDTNEIPSTLPTEAVPSEVCATIQDEAGEYLAMKPASLSVAVGERGIEHSPLPSKSAADTGQKQQKSFCHSDSGSPSLEQNLIGSPLDQHATTQDGEVSSSQVPVKEHAPIDIPANALLSNHVNDDTIVIPPALPLQQSPSADPLSGETSRPVPGCSLVDREQMHESIQQSEVPSSEQDVILDRSGSPRGNQISQTTSEHSPVPAQLADPHSIEQCQPDVPTSIGAPLPCNQFSLAASQQTDVPAPVVNPFSTEQCQLEIVISTCVPLPGIQFCQVASQQTEIPAPVVNPPSSGQCQLEVATSLSASLSDNQFSQAASQQIEVPAPAANPPSTEQCQLEVATSLCDSLPDNQFSQVASQQIEVPAPVANPPSTEQCQLEVATSQCASLPDNQFSQAASQQIEISAPEANPPSIEQCQVGVTTSLCALLPDNQFSQAASQQTEVPAPSANPPSTEQCQFEVATSTCADHERRNEHHASTAAQLAQVPAQSLAVEQTQLLVPTLSHPNSQSRPHLPMESLLNGSGSRLSDHRSMSFFPEVSPRPPHVPPVSSRIPQQLCSDPLQNELLRIRREEEQAIKIHEDEKMRLNFEFEKEMEEIRRKYNTKLLEAETEFTPKKKALETNFNLVFMNRILAEAFRLKCDATFPGSHGAKQGTTSGPMQQVRSSPSAQVAQRPAPVPVPPAATTAIPPVQAVHQPSALFSSTPVRAQLGPSPSPSRSHQIGTELRAPAPHLQSFRPMVSLPATSPLPHASMFPGQPSSNLTSTSIPSPQTSSPNIVPFSRAHHPENMGGAQGTPLLPVEFIMGVPTSNPQIHKSLHDIGQIIDTYDTVVRPGAATDVVCLSDDD